MDVTLVRRVMLAVLVLLACAPAAARADTQELLGFSASDYAFQTVGFEYEEPFDEPDFTPDGWGTGSAPFGALTTCTGIPAPTQTGGWVNNSDLLLRRTFTAPAGVGSGTVEVRVDNDVEVFINGESLGVSTHEGCAGASPPPAITIPSGLLQAGANLLALRARDRGDQRYIDARVVANVDRFAVDLDPGSIPAGAQRTLTATISNLGSATLESVTLTPPAGLSGGGTLSGLDIAPGASATRTVSVTAACGASGGTWSVTASAPGTAPVLAADESSLGTAVTGSCALDFSAQPNDARVSQVITTTQFNTPAGGPVVVQVRDAAGGLAAGANPVTLTRDPGSPGTGTLTGGGPQPAPGGTASFSQLRINDAGAYRLVATSPGATPDTSDPFMIEDAAVPCTATSCTATVASPLTSANVASSPLIAGQPAFVSISLNVGPAVNCAGYSEFSPDWVSVDGQNTRVKTLTYKISYKTLLAGWKTNGIALLQACYSAPYVFKTRNGVVTTSSYDSDGDGVPETWRTGLLPECKVLWITNPEPCVQQRKLHSDGISIISRLPGGNIDPKMRG